MRKHFLILMLLALLPFTAWAATYGDITVGGYTVTFNSPWHVVVAEPANSTPIPEFTVTGTGVTDFALTGDLRYQTVGGQQVNAISAPGLYFRKATFKDGTTDKVIFVPFYVSAKYSFERVNDATQFGTSLQSGFLKEYYKKYPFCDVDWTHTGGHTILYPGEYPTAEAGIKTGNGFDWDTNDQTKADAIAWGNEIFGPTYASYTIAHTWDAFYSVESNRNAFGFIFPNLEGKYYVEVTNGANIPTIHSWDSTPGSPIEFTAGKYSYTGQQELTTLWGFTTADLANIKYYIYPKNTDELCNLGEVYVIDASEDVDIHAVPVTINISSAVLNYKDAKNEPTITSVTVNGIPYSATEWPQLFTLQYYKKIGFDYIAQNADQVQNAGTYAVALVSKGATDADRGITYINAQESSKAEFVINKLNLEITLANATKQYGADDPTELEVTPGALPEGCVSIPTFTFNSLPRETGEDVVAAVYNYQFKLNDPTQTDITAQNYNLIIKNQPTLTIGKKTINLTYTGTMPVKTYGVAAVNPEFIANTTGIRNPSNYTVSMETPLISGDNLTTVLNGSKANYSYKYVDDKESANYDMNTTALIGGAAEHKVGITFAEDAATNYLFKVADVNLTVKQAQLTTVAADFSYSKKETADLTYNAAEQNVTKKVVYKTNSNEVLYDDEATTGFTSQVEITYKYKTAKTATIESDADMTTVGYYVAYVAPKANGNFYLPTPTAKIAAPNLDFTIKQANLYVYVTEETISKQYIGANIDLPTSDRITFQGMFNADKAKADYQTAMEAVEVKTVAETPSTQVKDVADYNIAPVVAGNSILRTNYNVVTYPTVFKVTPKAITLTPKGMNNVPYDQVHAGSVAATTSNVTVSKSSTDPVAIVNNDRDLVLSAYNYVIAENTYEAGKTYTGAISLVKKNATDISEDATKMLNNFSITATATADIKIANGTFTIIVKDKQATYGDKLTWNTFNYLTSGLTNPAITVKYKLVNTKTSETYSQNDEDALPKNAGTYNILVDEKNSSLEVANYTTPSAENGTIVAGTLTIAPKEVTIVADQVTVNEGSTVGALNTLGKIKVTFEGKLKDDDIAYKLAFNTDVVSVVTAEGPTKGNLNSPAAADPYNNGYKIVAATAEEIAAADNANYTFKFGNANAVAKIEQAEAKGKLKVVTANILLLSQQADDLMNVLEAADDGGHTAYHVTLQDVKFGTESTMKAKKWYSIVLPFKISVAQLSSTLGYAIVNRMDKTTSDGNLHFRLAFDEIPANEPFLVKSVKGQAGHLEDAVDINTVTFEDVYITKPSDVTVSIQTADASPIVFTGVYEKEHYLAIGDKLYNGSDKDIPSEVKKANNSYLNPFRSYWTAPAAARIFVEDLNEDGTTAIKEINAQMEEIATDGWYTVNGIKLQGAPTEKGIYIHNGKKIVLK